MMMIVNRFKCRLRLRIGRVRPTFGERERVTLKDIVTFNSQFGNKNVKIGAKEALSGFLRKLICRKQLYHCLLDTRAKIVWI